MADGSDAPDWGEIKGLIEAGNRAIEQVRSTAEEAKASADALDREKLARQEAQLAELLQKQNEIATRMQSLEVRQARPGAPGAEIGGSEYKAAFVDWIRSPKDPERFAKMHELHRKATDVRTSTDASGGYALPEEIAREIARQVQDVSPVRQFARVVQVGTPDYKELVDLRGFGAEWVGETDTRNKTNTPDIGEAAPTFGTLAAKPEATVESLDDLFFDVEGWLQTSAVEQFAKSEGAAFVSGDGTKKPTGFLAGTPVATADDSRTFGVLEYIPTGQAAALSANPFDELLDIVYKLKAGYRASSVWMMNSLTMAGYAKVKDANDNYILQPAVAADRPATMLGYPVGIAEDMPDIGADAFPVAFGDFMRGYLIADRVGMRIVRDEVTKPGYVRWIVSKRVGGCVKDSNALKLLKVAAS